MGPRERILDAATELFYREGYDATGINRVLEKAGAHKQSLYQHFQSKESLGLAYIRERSQEVSDLIALVTRKDDPLEMVDAWVRVLKREARKERFLGCPVVNMAAQTLQSPDMREELGAILQGWIDAIEEYFRRISGNPLLANQKPGDLARRLIVIYEGNTQMFLVTRDRKWLDGIARDFRACLKGSASIDS
ncbi:MAG: TetR/AcrR family transcriptional regulator [Leptospiraceae bacterium]|nr:TetR/AcrR family transcriptional regulator [Leptospiraceae bacterium]